MLPRAGGVRVWFGPDVMLRIWDRKFNIVPISRELSSSVF